MTPRERAKKIVEEAAPYSIDDSWDKVSNAIEAQIIAAIAAEREACAALVDAKQEKYLADMADDLTELGIVGEHDDKTAGCSCDYFAGAANALGFVAAAIRARGAA